MSKIDIFVRCICFLKKYGWQGLSTLAVALHSARTAAGVTQATLAAHLGVRTACVGMAETSRTGRINLGEEHLRAAASFLGCDPEYLLLARELSRASYALSQSHAQTAIALRDAWADLPDEAVEKIRQIAGGAL